MAGGYWEQTKGLLTKNLLIKRRTKRQTYFEVRLFGCSAAQLDLTGGSAAALSSLLFGHPVSNSPWSLSKLNGDTTAIVSFTSMSLATQKSTYAANYNTTIFNATAPGAYITDGMYLASYPNL